jgi:hypothetical protein
MLSVTIHVLVRTMGGHSWRPYHPSIDAFYPHLAAVTAILVYIALILIVVGLWFFPPLGENNVRGYLRSLRRVWSISARAGFCVVRGPHARNCEPHTRWCNHNDDISATAARSICEAEGLTNR